MQNVWWWSPVDDGSSHSGCHTIIPDLLPLVGLFTMQGVETKVTGKNNELLEECGVHQMLAASHYGVLKLILSNVWGISQADP